jgi:hypothetical protein
MRTIAGIALLYQDIPSTIREMLGVVHELLEFLIGQAFEERGFA